MVKLWIAWTCTLLPVITLACESADRRQCKEDFRALVGYRAEAIQGAFGGMLDLLPMEIHVKFVRTKDADYTRYAGNLAYDRERATLFVPRRVLAARMPNPVSAAAYYWPFYENEQYRQEFPVIEALDNLLWTAYLQEAAHAAGLSWPHRSCSSIDVTERLPCEMLIAGIAEHVKSIRGPLFNSNRIDIIWPKDFADFSKRVWRTDREYKNVQRYGGILLTRPLIDEFGIPRVLAYVARTPFQVDDDNLQTSARRYQNEARAALSVQLARPSAPLAQRTAHGIDRQIDRDRHGVNRDRHQGADPHTEVDVASVSIQRPEPVHKAPRRSTIAAAPAAVPGPADQAAADASGSRSGGHD